MALKFYKHKVTGEEKRSLKSLPKEEWDEVITAPNHKFMVSTDPVKRKSRMKGSDKILKARARNYARDVEIDDTIQINSKNGINGSVNKNLLNSKRERRRKIDDI